VSRPRASARFGDRFVAEAGRLLSQNVRQGCHGTPGRWDRSEVGPGLPMTPSFRQSYRSTAPVLGRITPCWVASLSCGDQRADGVPVVSLAIRDLLTLGFPESFDDSRRSVLQGEASTGSIEPGP
jgi:hypothetical protein